MKWSELVRSARTKRGWSVRKLGMYAGVDPSSISEIENEKSIGRGETIAKLAAALELDPMEVQRALSGGATKDATSPPSADELLEQYVAARKREREEAERRRQREADLEARLREVDLGEIIEVPVVEQRGSAGWGTVADAETVFFRPTSGRLRDEYLAVRVSGGCLEPDVPDGSTAIVDKTLMPEDGDLVLADHEGELLFKYLSVRDGAKYLVAKRQRRPIRTNGETTIIGVVVETHHRAPRFRKK